MSLACQSLPRVRSFYFDYDVHPILPSGTRVGDGADDDPCPRPRCRIGARGGCIAAPLFSRECGASARVGGRT